MSNGDFDSVIERARLVASGDSHCCVSTHSLLLAVMGASGPGRKPACSLTAKDAFHELELDLSAVRKAGDDPKIDALEGDRLVLPHAVPSIDKMPYSPIVDEILREAQNRSNPPTDVDIIAVLSSKTGTCAEAALGKLDFTISGLPLKFAELKARYAAREEAHQRPTAELNTQPGSHSLGSRRFAKTSTDHGWLESILDRARMYAWRQKADRISTGHIFAAVLGAGSEKSDEFWMSHVANVVREELRINVTKLQKLEIDSGEGVFTYSDEPSITFEDLPLTPQAQKLVKATMSVAAFEDAAGRESDVYLVVALDEQAADAHGVMEALSIDPESFLDAFVRTDSQIVNARRESLNDLLRVAQVPVLKANGDGIAGPSDSPRADSIFFR